MPSNVGVMHTRNIFQKQFTMLYLPKSQDFQAQCRFLKVLSYVVLRVDVNEWTQTVPMKAGNNLDTHQ